MPSYCYKQKDGDKEYDLICNNAEREEMEKECFASHAIKGIDINGEVFVRDFRKEWCGAKFHCASYPYNSDVLGVDGSPESINKAREESIRIGVPTDFTDTGEAVITSALHRKKLAEGLGYYDRNSYGSRYDAVRKTRN